jgi:hypothetical protein
VRGPGKKSLPHSVLSPEAENFVRAAYQHGWVLGLEFDWGQWMVTQEAERLRDGPKALCTATPEQLAELLTVLIRQDRFVEGALQSAFETGLLTRILERAASILAELDPDPDGSSPHCAPRFQPVSSRGATGESRTTARQRGGRTHA